MSQTPPCPICKGPVPEGGKHRPFCTSRCQLLDLGNWLDGRYAVPGEADVDDVEARESNPESDEGTEADDGPVTRPVGRRERPA